MWIETFDAPVSGSPVTVGYQEQAPAGAEHPNAGFTHDPVDTQTGSFAYSHADVAIPGRGPGLRFARSYNSYDARISARTGAMGPGWTHGFATRLADDGSSLPGGLFLHGPQGHSARFTPRGDGSVEAAIPSVDGVEKVLVTDEPHGGGDEPTGHVMITADLS